VSAGAGQRLVEVGQALRQEPGPVGPVVRAFENAVVQHEQGNHQVVRPSRRVQRRIVVNAQVAGEQDDGGAGTHRSGLSVSEEVRLSSMLLVLVQPDSRGTELRDRIRINQAVRLIRQLGFKALWMMSARTSPSPERSD
jgi:hypothetical protein